MGFWQDFVQFEYFLALSWWLWWGGSSSLVVYYSPLLGPSRSRNLYYSPLVPIYIKVKRGTNHRHKTRRQT